MNLIERARSGDDDAFLKLFQKYEQEIYRTAFIYVKNQNDALDAVQETAYRSFKSIKNLKEPKFFKTWLIRIAISCSLDILRKRKKVILLTPEFEEYITDDVEDANDIYILEVTVQDLIKCLNENEKSVIILRFYQDLTIREVSETMDIPLGTAKTVLYRALKKLRETLKGDGINEQ